MFNQLCLKTSSALVPVASPCAFVVVVGYMVLTLKATSTSSNGSSVRVSLERIRSYHGMRMVKGRVLGLVLSEAG